MTKLQIEVDPKTVISWRGSHREIGYEICQHHFFIKESLPPEIGDMGLPESIWNTYIHIREDIHEKVKHLINDAPFNGGQTFYRKITEEYIGSNTDFIEKMGWNKPHYKIGDDFNHLWDKDDYHQYNLEFMRRHIINVIDFLLDQSERKIKIVEDTK